MRATGGYRLPTEVEWAKAAQAGWVAREWDTQTAIFVNGCIVLLYVLALVRWNPDVRKLD